MSSAQLRSSLRSHFDAHRIAARFPAGRTHFTVTVRVLEGLDETEGLVDAAPHRQVVHGDLAQHLLVVDDEEAAQRVAHVLEVDAVVDGDLVRQVGEQRDLQLAQPSLGAGGVDPGQVGEVRVHRGGHHLRVQSLELCQPVVEGQDLRRADESAASERAGRAE